MLRVVNKDGVQAYLHQGVVLGNDLVYASLVGPREAVYAVWGSLEGHYPVRIAREEGAMAVSRPWQGYRSRSASLAKGVQHVLLLPKDESFFVGGDEEAEAEWVAGRLGMPTLPQWLPHVRGLEEVERLNRGVWAYGRRALYLPAFAAAAAREGVRQALREGRLPLPDEASCGEGARAARRAGPLSGRAHARTPGADPPSGSRMKLNEFMERHGAALFEQAYRSFPPLLPEPPQTPHRGGRKPLGAQGWASAAMAEAMRGPGWGFLVAEMSTGKTKMALDALRAYGPKERYLVLCPPHLVEKWRREAAMEGFRTAILDSPAAVRALPRLEGPLVAILSREQAKLGPAWEPAAVWRRRPVAGRRGKEVRLLATCPRCGEVLKDEEGLLLSAEALRRKRRKCLRCQGPLWGQRPPARVALGYYLKRVLPRGFFRALVIDEAHEYKAGGSAQGLAAAALADWVGRGLVLTGTLFGGYASDLFHLLWRFLPGFRQEYRLGEAGRFVEEYGLLERVWREGEEEDGRNSKRRRVKVRTKERPGLSPLLLPHLLPHSAFVRLADVAEGMPPYRERVWVVDLEGEHKSRVFSFYDRLSEAMKNALRQGSRRLLGPYVQAALSGPDLPFTPLEVKSPLGGKAVARLEPMPEGFTSPKEEVLLGLMEDERREGRRVLVYVHNTETHDLAGHLERLLRGKGYRAKALYAHTVSPSKREGWLAERVEEGVEVVICHPRLVQTGLDLIDFPTLVFYQAEYSAYALRQAARRSWRIGQERPVEVHFLAYRGTLQEAALRLVAAKARSSLALEGELVEGGLVAMGEEDPTLLLARALAGEGPVPGGLGAGVGLEEGAGLVSPVPRAKPTPAPAAPALPTLKADTWVRAGRRRFFLPAGQPVLFESA